MGLTPEDHSVGFRASRPFRPEGRDAGHGVGDQRQQGHSRFLGYGDSDPDRLVADFQEIMAIESDDGQRYAVARLSNLDESSSSAGNIPIHPQR